MAIEPCFEVKAETHEGSIHVLRRFATKEAAESHRVRMSHWKRVWIEAGQREKPDESFPPKPWNVMWIGGMAYLVDANEKKFASLLGTQARREKVAAYLCGFQMGEG